MGRPGHYTADDIRQDPLATLGSVADTAVYARAAYAVPPGAAPDVDFVIVGAGMSGLYSAWRLLQQDPNRKIVIVDRNDRTGGRLDSDVVEIEGDDVKEEEGGMRFTFNLMDNLMSLLLIFNLVNDVVPFPMNSGGNNRLYFRGYAFNNTEAEAKSYKKWSELYNLKQDEQGIDPSSVPNDMFRKIVKHNPHLGPVPPPEKRTPEFWQKFRLEYKWRDVLLKDWSLWDLAADMNYSNEFVTLLYRISGFNGTYLSEMNAGEAFQLLLDFPANPEFRTLANGFSTLPNALVDAILQDGKARISLRTNVSSIERLPDNSMRVFYTRSVQDTTQPGSISAKNVILALPRLALEKIFVTSPIFTSLPQNDVQKLWNTLLTTTNQALIKINLYYDRAWWGHTDNPAVDFGPNFSDLPLGSVYPFYTIDEELFAALEYQDWLKKTGQSVPDHLKLKIARINNGKFNKPAALTIYCDYLNINFWKALQNNGPLFDSELQRKFENMKPQVLYAASQRVVDEATKMFKLLFNTEDVPSPVLTSSRIWSGTTKFGVPRSEQVGYGVHQWGLHADDADTMSVLAQPIKGTNLFTCGEAYSDYQGWVEGALRSADLVLKKFNLEPISEVYEKEHDITPTAAITAEYIAISDARIRKYIDPNFPPHQ